MFWYRFWLSADRQYPHHFVQTFDEGPNAWNFLRTRMGTTPSASKNLRSDVCSSMARPNLQTSTQSGSSQPLGINNFYILFTMAMFYLLNLLNLGGNPLPSKGQPQQAASADRRSAEEDWFSLIRPGGVQHILARLIRLQASQSCCSFTPMSSAVSLAQGQVWRVLCSCSCVLKLWNMCMHCDRGKSGESQPARKHTAKHVHVGVFAP